MKGKVHLPLKKHTHTSGIIVVHARWVKFQVHDPNTSPSAAATAPVTFWTYLKPFTAPRPHTPRPPSWFRCKYQRRDRAGGVAPDRDVLMPFRTHSVQHVNLRHAGAPHDVHRYTCRHVRGPCTRGVHASPQAPCSNCVRFVYENRQNMHPKRMIWIINEQKKTTKNQKKHKKKFIVYVCGWLVWTV